MEDTVHDEDNSSSIEHILRPISYISWLFGVGWARPLKCPKAVTIIIRIVHLVVCSINVVFGPLASLFFDNEKTVLYLWLYKIYDAFIFMYCINWMICYLSSYYYIYHGISVYNKWPELMDRMKKLDQKIRKEIPFNDQPVIKVVTLAIFAVFVCCPLSLIVHVLYYYCIHPEYICTHHLLFYYMLSQSLINSFVFDVVVYVLYHRFQTINKLLGQLDELSDASWIALKIRHIKEMHHSICDLGIMVNDIHNIHLLLYSVNCFIMIVTILYKLHIGIKEEYLFPMIQNILWIPYIMQFVLMCWICTLAREESQRTAIFIYEFALNCKNLDRNCVRDEVNVFSNYLQQHQIIFTACDFFEINNALLYGFVRLIFADVIILNQFYPPINPRIVYPSMDELLSLSMSEVTAK